MRAAGWAVWAIGWAVWAVGMYLSIDYFVRAAGRGSFARLLGQAVRSVWPWVDIPSQAGHPFRPKAATHSEPRRPPIPL